MRRGHDERGGTVVLAHSPDGETFTPVAELHKDRFGAESVERPALVARPGGGHRLFYEAPLPDSPHELRTEHHNSIVVHATMKLEGLHHITMVTGDAQANVDFYADVLGLRLVKTTVNFDQPDAYHLYFGDERGPAGSILTWFEFAGARPGTAGAGMVHLIELGVPGAAALEFWEQRLRAHEVATERDGDTLRFADPEGLAFALVPATNPPLQAAHREVPAEHAITGVEGARAYATQIAPEVLATAMGFEPGDGEHAYVLAGDERRVRWAYDPAPGRGVPGAGTVHHIAFASRDEDHRAWQARVRDAGLHVTDVRDRDYFLSIYFQEPSGVLFEIATLSPGFAADEDPDHLGEALRLPAQHEHLHDRLERRLTPLTNPRAR